MPAGPDSASSKSYIARSRLWVTMRRINGSSSTTSTLGLLWVGESSEDLGAGIIVILFYNGFIEYSKNIQGWKQGYNSFQKAFVQEILRSFKLISRRENRPIPFLK